MARARQDVGLLALAKRENSLAREMIYRVVVLQDLAWSGASCRVGGAVGAETEASDAEWH
jgi:hypothetical protein